MIIGYFLVLVVALLYVETGGFDLADYDFPETFHYRLRPRVKKGSALPTVNIKSNVKKDFAIGDKGDSHGNSHKDLLEYLEEEFMAVFEGQKRVNVAEISRIWEKAEITLPALMEISVSNGWDVILDILLNKLDYRGNESKRPSLKSLIDHLVNLKDSHSSSQPKNNVKTIAQLLARSIVRDLPGNSDCYFSLRCEAAIIDAIFTDRLWFVDAVFPQYYKYELRIGSEYLGESLAHSICYLLHKGKAFAAQNFILRYLIERDLKHIFSRIATTFKIPSLIFDSFEMLKGLNENVAWEAAAETFIFTLEKMPEDNQVTATLRGILISDPQGIIQLAVQNLKYGRDDHFYPIIRNPKNQILVLKGCKSKNPTDLLDIFNHAVERETLSLFDVNSKALLSALHSHMPIHLSPETARSILSRSSFPSLLYDYQDGRMRFIYNVMQLMDYLDEPPSSLSMIEACLDMNIIALKAIIGAGNVTPLAFSLCIAFVLHLSWAFPDATETFKYMLIEELLRLSIDLDPIVELAIRDLTIDHPDPAFTEKIVLFY